MDLFLDESGRDHFLQLGRSENMGYCIARYFNAIRDTLVLSKSRWLVDGYSCFLFLDFSPDSDIAIGVLTSKKGGGRRTTLADWTWHQAGAIVGCHCSVLWLGGRVTTNFRGVDVVPLLAFAGCHCSVLWWGKGRVTTNFGWVGVPLHGAHGTLHSNRIQKMHPEKLPWASCRRYTVLYIDDTKIGFCYLGSMLVKFWNSERVYCTFQVLQDLFQQQSLCKLVLVVFDGWTSDCLQYPFGLWFL